ncbi:Bovicin 255 peptide [Lactobacillus equicursoris DSM 19284 = JCM 14600 = CIP 110162]|uniref:garvicin Q family class II bacteriocin n=1 Tax=Lactobacillus equicursoris TaxID=420645 RepID=UPI000283FFA2|nr:garvicin Q family class II bacteriocin [Lactobacillus equicursoris]CCK84999.1 Bovicin 255 peptide [Lactobacillus equicursoris DSM 19284 = JCM 14600 = CIP 110162]
MVDTVNKELADYNVEVDQSVPTISLARAKSKKSTSRPKPVAYGANGYWYRDKKGGWHYVVTKSPAQAVFDVFRNGVESSLGGGWISGAKKTKAYQDFINGRR